MGKKKTLSDQVVTPRSSAHVAEVTTLCNSLEDKIAEAQRQVESLRSSDNPDRDHGVSFLELKHEVLLEYNIHLAFFMLLKVEGKSVEDHPVIERLIYLRTLLEKLRPIEAKLKYQLDKLVKSATAGIVQGGSNPLSFKPKPASLVAKQAETDEADTTTETHYQPPKLAAVPYDDDPVDKRQAREARRARERMLQSTMLDDLRQDFSDRPIEIRESTERGSDWKYKEEKREYEEENFTRLSARKEKKPRRKSQGDELTSFDFSGFQRADEASSRRKSVKQRISDVSAKRRRRDEF
eukprot:m.16651 g.16651  ORF g.16651 m.16651 type:complete len:295 (+) comp28546_c0_seq1:6481-7365(+)